METEVVGIIGELSHLSMTDVGITFCGIVITAAWGARKFFWVRQVGCKDCREELAKNTKSPYENRRK